MFHKIYCYHKKKIYCYHKKKRLWMFPKSFLVDIELKNGSN